MDLLPTFAGFADDNMSAVTNPAAETNLTENGGSELFQGYSAGLLTFASVVCYVFMMLGIPGNLITIIALARCKKVRNATAVFIINLSLSDLLFCCFNLPLAASTFWHRDWVNSQLLCAVWPLLRYGLMAVSLFTILAITINRYIMIGHPRQYPRIYRRRYLLMMVACTWILAFSALIPTWGGFWGKFGLDHSIGSCSILKDKNGNSPKEFLFVIAFALPCLCILVCYARIFYIVRRTAIRSREPALRPGISNRTIDRPQNSNNTNSSSTEEHHQFTAINMPMNCDTRRRASSSAERDLLADDDLVVQTTSQKRRYHLTKVKDEDLKFIDTSVDSSDNYFKNMTTTLNNPRDKVERGEQQQQQQQQHDDTLGNGMLLLSTGERTDSALEEDEKDESTGADAKTMTMINGSQYLAVLVEPSSSSGIDVALDHEEPPPPREKRRKYVGSLKRSIRYKRRQGDKNNNSNAGRKGSTMGNNTSASAIYPGKMTTKDRRLLKMILVIFISFLMSYLPITVTKINSSLINNHVVNILSYLLIYLTTCMNPIIYVVMSSEYRQAYWNLILCRVNAYNRREAALAKQRSNNNQRRLGSVKT